jgi:hypothetical protein
MSAIADISSDSSIPNKWSSNRDNLIIHYNQKKSPYQFLLIFNFWLGSNGCFETKKEHFFLKQFLQPVSLCQLETL